jgi:uncharacterized YigZ family protein
MLFDDTYLTVEKPAEGIFRDRGSKFLGFVCPLESETALKPLVTHLKSVHPKANHLCWAMRLTIDRSIFRINDDGEPAGTAGRPILNVLLSKNLTNIGVVVVRYFGGTLLGVPGLIHAYKSATEEALKAAHIIEQTVKDIYTVSFSYLQMNAIMKMIKEEELDIISQQFDNECSLTIAVRKVKVNRITERFGALPGVQLQYQYTV